MKEQFLQNKRLILVMGVLVLLVSVAAFIAGKLLNNKVSPLGRYGLGGKGDEMTVVVDVLPAPELPTTRPEVVGPFVERQDNTIVIRSVSLKAGEGGEVKVVGGKNDGPKVEIVITNETMIYRDIPQSVPSGETATIQQTVAEGTLDDLNSQSMITVWGRKSGDRIIAGVLLYGNPVRIKAP